MNTEVLVAQRKFTHWLDDRFKITARGSTLKTEFLAAVTTFATMSYVLAAHPQIMADAGMDRAAVITVTALVAGLFSILMGLMSNFPMAQAPAMGCNALFTYTIVLGMGIPWQGALGLVFWSGIFFLALSVSGVRRLLMEAFPEALKCALTAGIGLFLLMIGLKGAGVVVGTAPPVLMQIGDMSQPSVLLCIVGVPLVMALMARKIPGGIIVSIAILTIIGFFIPLADGSRAVTEMPTALMSMPVPFDDLFLALDFGYLWRNFGQSFPVLLSLIFIDLFSSLAAMSAMCKRADLVDKDGNMINAKVALSADALGAVGASLLGTSTGIVYGESAAGIESGGRTGLTAIFVGVFFLFALFFNPLFLIIPAQATAPALVFIGFLMFAEAGRINYKDTVMSGSAILTIVLMTTTSISDGLAIGLIVYVAAMLLSGRRAEIPPMSYVLALCFGAYYALA
ncbi:MAG: NCS2 family permease [Pseudomonadota bacterium]